MADSRKSKSSKGVSAHHASLAAADKALHLLLPMSNDGRKFAVGQTVHAADDIPYPDKTIAKGTAGDVTNATTAGDTPIYMVQWSDEDFSRMAFEDQLK